MSQLLVCWLPLKWASTKEVQIIGLPGANANKEVVPDFSTCNARYDVGFQEELPPLARSYGTKQSLPDYRLESSLWRWWSSRRQSSSFWIGRSIWLPCSDILRLNKVRHGFRSIEAGCPIGWFCAWLLQAGRIFVWIAGYLFCPNDRS